MLKRYWYKLMRRINSAILTKVMKVDVEQLYGKSFQQYAWFIDQVRRGKRVIVNGPNYVIMSKKRYNELMKRDNY